MKKRIIIPAILSAVLATGLTSCVKDNESDSVRDLRNAKANELNANAKKTESETKINEAAKAVKLKSDEADLARKLAMAKTAEFDLKKAELELAEKVRQDALDAAGSQAKIDAAVISATAALEKVKHDVEIAKLDAEKAWADAQTRKSEAETAAANATLALIQAQQKLAGEKAQAYEQAVMGYTQLLVDVEGKKKDINIKKNDIEGLKKDVDGAKRYVERQTALKNSEIAALEKAIKTLEDSKQYTTAQLQVMYAEELAKYYNAMNVYSDEFRSDKLENLGKVARNILTVDFAETDVRKAFGDIKKFYDQNPFVVKQVGYNLSTSGDYFQSPFGVKEQRRLVDGSLVDAAYYTFKPAKVNAVAKQQMQHAVAEIEQEAVATQIELDKLNADATNSYSVAYAETKMNEAKTAWEEAKAAQPPVLATITAKWTAYQNAQTKYESKLNDRKSAEVLLAPVNEHKALYNKAIAQLSTAGLENHNAVVTKFNEAAAKHFEQDVKERNLKLAAKEFGDKAAEYHAILGDSDGSAEGSYKDIDARIESYRADIENIQKDIAQLSNVVTAQDALNVAEQQLKKLEEELGALNAKVTAAKSKMEALKP